MLKICEIDPYDIGCNAVWLHDHTSDYTEMRLSMEASGQMMPIFVAHTISGNIVVDGWKRLRVARDLGIKIQAVTWQMTHQSAVEFRASGRYVDGCLDYDTLSKGPGVAIYDCDNDNYIAVPWDMGRRVDTFARAYKLPYQWISKISLASNYLLAMR